MNKYENLSKTNKIGGIDAFLEFRFCYTHAVIFVHFIVFIIVYT